jgi:diaminopimelate decarboxylase
MKKTFVSLDQLKKITEKYPTPFHLYDEKGIRENARRLYEAFSWNPGFKEYFAVKATPNPSLIRILKEEGCGVDCSSYTELMLSDAIGFSGEEIMFSSNVTPPEDFILARKLNAIINLDDINHIYYFNCIVGSMVRFSYNMAFDVIGVPAVRFSAQSLSLCLLFLLYN